MTQKNIVLIILIIMGAFTLKAQEIYGTSDSLKMDFGYPTIELIDDIQFLDEYDNNHIDPGETISISFTIENKGKYIAKSLSIHPQEYNNIAGLEFTESVDVGDLAPGENRLIQVGIASSDDLPQGTASFIFKVHENGQYDDISVIYAVGTGKKE